MVGLIVFIIHKYIYTLIAFRNKTRESFFCEFSPKFTVF